MIDKLTSARGRQWMYSISTALLALLVGYNIVAPEHVPLWLGFVAALLAISATSTAAVTVKQQRDAGILHD